MKKLGSMTVFAIGLLLCFGSPARAQLGEMGEAVKKGATDAAKEELMKKAGLPTAVPTPAATPATTPEAAETPAAEPGAGSGKVDVPAGEAEAVPAAEVPAGEGEVAPEAAEAPPAGSAEEMIEKKAAEMEEKGRKQMMPELP
jgi:hypothetical protein